MKRALIPIAISTMTAVGLVGCDSSSRTESSAVTQSAEVTESVAQTPEAGLPEKSSGSSLADILATQPEEVVARYVYRNPQQTLEFFGIQPGMTVVEALPGGGWYSKLLIPYLGSDGKLVGANYPTGMYKLFGYDEERLAKMANWATDWPATAQTWTEGEAAQVSGFVMGELDEGKKGTADAVLLIRALHNLARFEADHGYLSQAIQDTFDVLKPGGVLGVVQHAAPSDADDAWANGSKGYLKQTFVIAKMEAAGFEFVGASDINANPLDLPGADDVVWRLPPTLAGSKEDEARAAAMQAIGESNRMTLKFVKPLS